MGDGDTGEKEGKGQEQGESSATSERLVLILKSHDQFERFGGYSVEAETMKSKERWKERKRTSASGGACCMVLDGSQRVKWFRGTLRDR